MSNYRPYPKTKPSGVEWLGDVPEAWEITPLKHAATLRTQKSVGRRKAIGLENIESWSGRYIETESEFEGDGVAVESGDILFGKLRPYLAKALIVTEPSDAVGDFHAMRPNRLTHTRFLLYQILSKEFIVMVDGSTFGSKMPRASWEFVGKMQLPFPPLPEQHHIAAFLDRECGKLDALQAKQERLIELLKEKRQALISHAVTRGLDPNAKLKPSGIEWLGEVPVHWVTPQLKFLIVGIDQGKSPECEARIAEPDEWGVMKSGCVNWGIFREEEHKALPPHIAPILTTEVREGDLLMSRASGSTDLIGSVAYVENVRPRLLLSDKIFRLKAGKACDPRFIWRMAGTIPVRRQIELSINGAEGLANNITKESIRNLYFALPPLVEQRAIVAHLDEKCGKIDQLKAKAERGIELLKERRSALISAAVTGKIDVRDV
jgi:type I restriction enzyme, S subunit